MENPILPSLTQNKKFLLKRIGEEDIEINNAERMVILKALNENIRFVQVRDYTLMLNGIKSIDPKPRDRREKYAELEAPKPLTEKEREQARGTLEKIREIVRSRRVGGDK